MGERGPADMRDSIPQIDIEVLEGRNARRRREDVVRAHGRRGLIRPSLNTAGAAVTNTEEELKAAMLAEFRQQYRRQRNPHGSTSAREQQIADVTVYAIAKVIVTRAMKDYAERLRPQEERLLEAVEQRNTLIKFISVLTN
ncbi:unnamed protein product [Heligmosomoides polygyrus]|uniref:Uncharacterized protein n=1 Tax=Heligmosomoides polygyrus TaxID=6339 RepID=A0A3P7THS7_HELPZ|nr:unnamed protein product [Heligmosomoides polygyrus]